MKNQYYLLVFITALSINLPKFVAGQGCSDAGFCTLGPLQPENNDSTMLTHSQFITGTFSGLAAKGVIVWGQYLEIDHSFSNRFSTNIKLTSLAQIGNKINVWGLGDVFITPSLKLSKHWGVIGGIKIPLTKADKELNGIPLPMDYQSSFGTTDIIAGIKYRKAKWQLTAAYQMPLTQNKNKFLISDYPEDSPMRKFFSTNGFNRMPDAMLRIAYGPFNTSNRSNFTPALLSVYHITNDSYRDIDANEVIIENSRGLTLNLNFFWDYNINSNQTIQINLGAPVYAREARPDGSTRNVLFNIEYRFGF
jgi:hypothetical protein